MNIQNNTILITGGTGGFGYAFASKLLALGNTVIITGRSESKLLEVKRKLPAVHIMQCDVTQAEEIDNLYHRVSQQFPNLNILINNAGEMRKIRLQQEQDPNELTREVEINLMGPIWMVQAFLTLLKRQQKALILNVTSGIALVPFAISPIYSASKAGLRSYTQALRVQLKNTDVKVMELVAPGSSTSLNDKFMKEDGFNSKLLMAPEKIVDAAIKGMRRDKNEVFPGLAKMMRIMSRLAPKRMISLAGKTGRSFMYGTNHINK